MSWEAYESLSQAQSQGDHVRLAYDGKDLELMTTSDLHEFFKQLLNEIVSAIVEALEIDTNTPELASYGEVFFDDANAGTVNGASLQAGSGNVIKMLNASNAVISTGTIETPTLVKVAYSG